MLTHVARSLAKLLLVNSLRVCMVDEPTHVISFGKTGGRFVSAYIGHKAVTA